MARNAREQAKENEYLRVRVRELEREIGPLHEKLRATQTEARKSHTETEGREMALLSECAANEAAATQLEEELNRMRAIEEQSAVESMHLIAKMSRLQTEVAQATRRANIAEEMLMGFQTENERSALDAERWRLEAERIEVEHRKQTELEERHELCLRELTELRDENALMRADIRALRSGMEARLRFSESVNEAAEEEQANVLYLEAGDDSNEDEDEDEDETFGTPSGAGYGTPKKSPIAPTGQPGARSAIEASPETSSDSPRDGKNRTNPTKKEKKNAKGDGVIYLRGRAVRVEGATPGGARERPPAPRLSGWASPARSSFAKKMLAQFEKAEGASQPPLKSTSPPIKSSTDTVGSNADSQEQS